MTAFFVWDMERTILGTGIFSLRWYSLFFITGLSAGYLWMAGIFKGEGKSSKKLDDLFLYVVAGTIAGARLGHCMFYDPIHYLSTPWEILKIWEGGLASHGGYLGVILGIFLFCRRNRDIPFLWLLDRISIAGLLAGGFIRIGNFFNSEILGKPAQVPWAVIFRQVDEIPRHPVQIYEALGYMGLSLGLYGVYRLYGRNPLRGRLFGLALIGGFGFRFLIESLKENQAAFESGLFLNMGQWLSLPFIAAGIFMAASLHRGLPADKG